MSLNNIDDVDQWIQIIKDRKQILPERQLRMLCEKAKQIMIEESNVHPVSPPVIVCGDIHGQFYDLLEIFETAGPIQKNKYIFMGDFVDRGHHSIQTISLLLAYKVKYPDSILLLRGNHETRQISYVYGFYDQVQKKYGNINPWKYIMEVFDLLCIGAHINGQVLCIHGGLSPNINLIDQIRLIDRQQEVPSEGAFSDLMWSDPEEGIETWAKSPRGAGFLFGSRAADQFCHLNDLNLICRAHQLSMEGYKYWFKNQNVLTVWSAPNYSYRMGNKATVLKIRQNMSKMLQEVEKSTSQKRVEQKKQIVPYFL